MRHRQCRTSLSLQVLCLVAIGFLSIGVVSVDSALAVAVPSKGFLTFVNPSPSDTDLFGAAVTSINGDVFVSASAEDQAANNAGIVYRFDGLTGASLGSILSPAAQTDGFFGGSLTSLGNDLVVAAPGEGIVHIIDGGTGQQKQSFVNSTGTSFGLGIAASEGEVLIGAPRQSAFSSGGTAFLYDAVSGSLQQTFNNPMGARLDEFGAGLALDKDFVVIGAWGDDNGAARNVGAVHVFNRSTGDLFYTLRDPTPFEFDDFGEAIAINDGRVLVGSTGDDVSGLDAGAAHLFDVTTGELLQTFANPNPERFAQFGSDVAIDGDFVLVGASGANLGGHNAGAAYAFRASTGELIATFLNPTASIGAASFGDAVMLKGNRVLVGAPQDDSAVTNGGIAYAFTIVPEPSAIVLGMLGCMYCVLTRECRCQRII